MPVRELTPTDALAYRLLTSSAFGGSVDPDDPAASAPLSPGQTAGGIDSAALPGGAGGVLAAAARIAGRITANTRIRKPIASARYLAAVIKQWVSNE